MGPPLTEAYLQVLPWSGKTDYLAAEKTVWRIHPSDTDAAGYARTVGNFTQVHLCVLLVEVNRRGREGQGGGRGGREEEREEEERASHAILHICLIALFILHYFS